MIQDTITLTRIKTIHPVLLNELKKIYTEICQTVNSQYCQVRFTDVLRNLYEQAELYAQGRSKIGNIVTWAKAGDSYHNYGLAVDICLLIDKDRNGTFETASWNTVFDGNGNGVPEWLEVVKIFNKYGWTWGLINSKGRRYDLPHFQKTFGYKTKELKKLPKDKFGYPILNLAA